jgi:hypothetical protein
MFNTTFQRLPGLYLKKGVSKIERRVSVKEEFVRSAMYGPICHRLYIGNCAILTSFLRQARRILAAESLALPPIFEGKRLAEVATLIDACSK